MAAREGGRRRPKCDLGAVGAHAMSHADAENTQVVRTLREAERPAQRLGGTLDLLVGNRARGARDNVLQPSSWKPSWNMPAASNAAPSSILLRYPHCRLLPRQGRTRAAARSSPKPAVRESAATTLSVFAASWVL